MENIWNFGNVNIGKRISGNQPDYAGGKIKPSHDVTLLTMDTISANRIETKGFGKMKEAFNQINRYQHSLV